MQTQTFNELKKNMIRVVNRVKNRRFYSITKDDACQKLFTLVKIIIRGFIDNEYNFKINKPEKTVLLYGFVGMSLYYSVALECYECQNKDLTCEHKQELLKHSQSIISNFEKFIQTMDLTKEIKSYCDQGFKAYVTIKKGLLNDEAFAKFKNKIYKIFKEAADTKFNRNSNTKTDDKIRQLSFAIMQIFGAKVNEYNKDQKTFLAAALGLAVYEIKIIYKQEYEIDVNIELEKFQKDPWRDFLNFIETDKMNLEIQKLALLGLDVLQVWCNSGSKNH